jgi:crotonobetainyl-CoA:carnitine CoA-transferase CaiB-like acyl-CoA transferase
MNGIRVLDLSRVLAGPWAAQHLADQGAEVIKVEPPGGDETRGFGPFVDGHSTYFMAANRDKRSIVLDLHTDAARRVLDRLLARADVLLENYRPGVAERLGFGWTHIHPRFPRLCYVAIHAFGHPDEGIDPAWTGRPGYDLVLQAMGGGAAATGFPGDPPLKHSTSIADLFTGLYASQAALVALLERERTGRTQKIVVNMLQVQATALAHHATRYLNTGELEQQRGNSHRGLAPYDLYRGADGWIALACGNDAMWRRLVVALNLEDQPQWADNRGRVAHRSEVDAAIAAALGGRPVAELDDLLAAAGVPAGPVLALDRTLQHPAVSLALMDHAAVGPISAPGPGFVSLTTRASHGAPPLLDASRATILSELGFSVDEASDLAADGAFGDAGRAPG